MRRLKFIAFMVISLVFICFLVRINAQTSSEVQTIVKEAEKLILEKGLYKDAIKKLETAIQKDQNYAPAYLNLGRAYHFQLDYETAIKYYKKALELDPAYGEACYNIGSCYASLKDYEDGIKWLEKAKDIFYRKNELERYKKTLAKLIDYASGDRKKNYEDEMAHYPPPTVTPFPTGSAVASASPTPVPVISTPVSLPVSEDMALVSAGKFWMGSDEKDVEGAVKISKEYGDNADRSWFADETPRHEVYLDGFYIDKCEVTNEEFSKFVLSTGYRTDAEREGKGYIVAWEGKTLLKEIFGADWQHPTGQGSGISGRMNYPVVQVSWNDAAAYAKWAAKRLPTEAEWEKACRGTDGRIYPWGNTWNDNYCNNWNLNLFYLMDLMPDFFNGRGTLPAGKIAAGASPYGVMDMAGNAWEWCADWYGSEYYKNSPASNPGGPQSGKTKTLRGGPWYYINPAYFRSTVRFEIDKEFRSFFIGFRCVKDGK